MADNLKEIKDYTGEELAEVLSGEFSNLLRSQASIVNSILILHGVQNELERRKLDAKPRSD